MKKGIALTLLFVLVSVALYNVISEQIAKTTYTTATVGQEVHALEGDLKIGNKAPPFTLPLLMTEQPLALADMRGQNVIVNFWATWCPPCRAEMPAMQRYYDKYKREHNVEIIAVNLTESDRGLENIQKFVEQYHLTFPIVLDEQEQVSKQYEAISIPATFIVNEQGEIAHHIVGPVDEPMLVDLVGNLQ